MDKILNFLVVTMLSAVIVVALGIGAAIAAASDPTNAPDRPVGGLSPVPARVDPGTDIQNALKGAQR